MPRELSIYHQISPRIRPFFLSIILATISERITRPKDRQLSAMYVDGRRAKSRLIFFYRRRYVDGSFKRRIKEIANRKLSRSTQLFQTFVCTRGVHFSNEQSNKHDESSWKVHAENVRLPFDSLLAAGTSRIAPIKSQSSCEISTQRGSQSRC